MEKMPAQKRKRGWVGAVAQAEPRAPSGKRVLEHDVNHGERDAVQQTTVHSQFEMVIEYMVAHFVPEHRLDFGQ